MASSSDNTSGKSGKRIPVFKPGFPHDIVVGVRVESKFLCFLCNGILRSPLQSYCGHRFCKACIQKLLAGKEFDICPSCKAEEAENEFSRLSLDKLFPDNAIKRDFKSVQAKCINPGCTWTGTLNIYEDHDNTCEYQSNPCPLCGARVAIKSKGFHESNECPERPWNCEYCRADMPYKLAHNHLINECLYAPLDCKYCSKKRIPRAQLGEHYGSSCSQKRILCPICQCNDGVEVGSLPQHKEEKVVSHIDNVSDSVKQLIEKQESTKAAIQKELENNKKMVHNIEQKMQEIQASFRDTSRITDNTPSQGITTVPQGSNDAPVSNLDQRLQIQDAKIATFESIASVLNTEILKCLNKIEDQARRIGEDANQIVVLNTTVRELENSNRAKDELIARLQTEITRFTDTSYEGTFVWKIEGVTKKRQDAMSGRTTSFYSPAFFTSRTGYKTCARVYLNGDGMGRGSHISFYFVIMKGEYDALLKWPFRQKVTLMLLDQNRREHIIDAFRPDPSSSSFKQPVSDMNIASGCPLFCPLSTVDNMGNKAYIKNDTMYFKIVIDTSDLV